MDDTPRERQENELAVLQSILLEDCFLRRAVEPSQTKSYRDVTAKADDNEDDVACAAGATPRLSLSDLSPTERICYRVRLEPQQSKTGADVHACIDLDVELPEAYPNSPPVLKLLNAKGVPKDKVTAKEEELKKLTLDQLGEEVIFSLVQDIQTWLIEFNRPQLSFYEQMIASKLQQERLEQEEQERQLREEQLEIERRQAIEQQQIKDELNRREEERKKLKDSKRHGDSPVKDKPVKTVSICSNVQTLVFSTDEDSSAQSSPSIRRPSDRPSQDLPPLARTMAQPTPSSSVGDSGLRSDCIGNFDNVTIGRGLGRSCSMGCRTCVAMTTHGEVVCLCQWQLQCRSGGKRSEAASNFPPGVMRRLRQVVSIEQELMKWQAVSHCNLVHYLGMRHWQDAGEMDLVHIEVMKEYVSGGSLAKHLENMTTNVFQGELLNSCSEQLLSAVAYLHSQNIVHRQIQLTNVFLDDAGKIRLSDYSIMRRIGDLFKSLTSEDIGKSVAVPCNPPSFEPLPSKKGDVFRMGLTLLALSQGDSKLDYNGSFPTAVHVSLAFKEFIERCLDTDDRLRPSARELVEMYFSKDAQQPPNTLTLRSGNPSPPTVGSPGFYQDPLPNFSAMQRSRLMTEFDYVEMLGSGGFGDVFKVRNKLDGCAYAIKRIRLERRHAPFNSKISREVKLLSRLNHENVVRYYNSWIETQLEDTSPWGLPLNRDSDDDEEDDDDDSFDVQSGSRSDSHSTSSESTGKSGISFRSTFRPKDLLSRGSSSSVAMSVSESSGAGNDSNQEDIFDLSFGEDEKDYSNISSRSKAKMESSNSDESVIFGNNGAQKGAKEDEFEDDDDDVKFADDECPNDLSMPKFLYIQMEYCEQSTLRDVIDKQNLFRDPSRVWRLFRELVDGIAHIHEQAMIHRDLKPPNVFLDSSDRIKIGDFGLATTHSHSMRQNSFFGPSLNSGSNSPMSEEAAGSGSMTSRVGTALYIAPELNSVPRYTQKVDIYSLGIIFFEMCTPPVQTAMERMKTLSGLRSEDLIFPASFDESAMEKQAHLVRWMLKHNPHKRPSARDLQQSDFLPITMEDKEMKEVLRHTLASTNSTRYRELMSSLFSQPTDSVVDFTYDLDLHKGSGTITASLHHTDVQDRLTKIFRRHGAVIVSTPQLTPYHSSSTPESVMCLMDRHGGLVTLQHDLRSSFARSVARNDIQHLKRFMIGKVFRDKKVRGAHPLEIYECAFDIVTPTPGQLLSDAEVIFSVFEVIQEFDHLHSLGHVLYLNHTSMAQALLRHCSVPQSQFAAVFAVLFDVSNGRIRWTVAQTKLSQLSMSELAIRTLQQYIFPMDVEKAKDKCITMKREKGSTSMLIDTGIHEIETIISHLHAFGMKTQIMFDFTIVHNINTFSGIMFRVQPLAGRRQRRNVVLAAGGRYDKLLVSLAPSSQQVAMSAVGVSLAVDHIVSGYNEREREKDEMSASLCEVLVSSLGREMLLSDRIKVVRDLWAAGISADVHSTVDANSSDEYCRTMGIPFLVLLKDRYMLESGNVKVRQFERDRTTVLDRMVPIAELVEFILNSRRGYREGGDSSGSNRVSQCSNSSEGPSSTGSIGPSSGVAPVNITLMPIEKLATHVKRKYQTGALLKVAPLAHKFGMRPPMELLAIEVPKTVIQDMRATLDLSLDETEFLERALALRSRHSKYRKYLIRVCDSIRELVYDKKLPIVFLYSCREEFCEVLL